MPIGIGTAAVIGAAASAGSGIYAANKQSSSAREAGTIQSAANKAALDYQRESDARASKQYDEERTHNWAAEDLDRAVAAQQRTLQNSWTAEDRAMYAADRDRRIEQGKPFAALAGQSVGTLQNLLFNNGGGQAFHINQPPYTPTAPHAYPLPPAAERETMQQMLARRAANAAQ